MKTDYCTDTHPLVWYFKGQKELSPKAKDIFDQIFKGRTKCYLSCLVLLETFHISLKPKKKFNFPKFLKNLAQVNINAVPLDKNILSICYQLPKHLEIHDRVITATAIVTDTVLITKDPQIIKINGLETIW